MKRKLGLMIISVLVLAAALVAFELYVYTTYIYKPADYTFNYKIKSRKAMSHRNLEQNRSRKVR